MFQNEKVIESKNCKHCNSKFEITDKDLEFYEKVSPVFGGKKFLIPSPTLCPDCRQQRRMSFRNERKLYKRKCDATGKDIISIYSPDKPYKIYNSDYWWSDKWDPMDYGKTFDFSRGFFEQLYNLLISIPRYSLRNFNNNENSEFTNEGHALKNCYLTFDAGECENVYYSNWIGNSKSSCECAYSLSLENCYECVNCFNCSFLYYSINCYDCNNCINIRNCIGCSFCYLCDGLQNKKYCYKNKEYSREEYEKVIKDLKLGYKNDLSNIPKKDNVILQSENCFGNNIKNSKDLFYAFDVFNSRNSKYLFDIWDTSDVYDYYESWNNSSMCYEGETNGNVYFGVFTSKCLDCKSIFYCNLCDNCENCFGCVGLRNKSYCILNKQYTREEYEILVPQIIEHMTTTGEWGKFFPSSISPFGYNETVAQEYFPLSRSTVIHNDCHSELVSESLMQGNTTKLSNKDPELNSGGQYSEKEQNPPTPLYQGGKNETFLHGSAFNWSDYEAPFPKVDKIIPASKLPDDISSIPDDILNWAIECEVTKKPFRIIKQELEFYRKHNLPIPKRHPDQRHLDRMRLRNPRKLFDRKCDKCGKDIKTTYSPDRSEIVYCEECYNKEIY